MSKARKRDVLIRYKMIISFLIRLVSFLPYRFKLIFFNYISTWSGQVAIGLRYLLVKSICKQCGDNVSIHRNVVIISFDNLELNNNISIHPFVYIDATGGVEIGNDVSIANHTTILSTEHCYSDRKIPIKDQGVIIKKTIITNNVWIGAGVRVLAGSVIKTGVIIAAGAVVKNELQENTIYGGVPAKKIKER